jgi:hypothetical protein
MEPKLAAYRNKDLRRPGRANRCNIVFFTILETEVENRPQIKPAFALFD